MSGEVFAKSKHSGDFTKWTKELKLTTKQNDRLKSLHDESESKSEALWVKESNLREQLKAGL
ncbi:MAG: hypothetical protein KA715_11095 [Xanthomonadaceae bacterium]|nr:hypothetical protein [Xanthomonadaceae bacterium]